MADIHNAETSLDYEGTYKGVLPAADCPGIETTLILNPDVYKRQHLYLQLHLCSLISILLFYMPAPDDYCLCSDDTTRYNAGAR